MSCFLLGESGNEDHRPALFEAATGTQLSYAQLRQQVAAQVPVVTASEAKSLIFLFCRNDLSTVIMYIAAVESGQAVTLLDASLNSELRDALIERYRPELVVGCSENLAGYKASAPMEKGLVLQRRLAGETEPPPHPELAVLLSTSGSTGSPKLVRLSQAAVEVNADSIGIALGLDRDERPVSSLPLHYSYGLSILNSHLVAGAEVVLTSDGILTEEFWHVVRDRGCTSFAGVPYSYQLLRRLELGRLLPATVRTLTQAGGKLADPLINHYHSLMKERSGRFYVMYGQTEAAPRITTLPAERLQDKLGSVGLPMAGGSLRVDVDGSTATEANVIGEVIYRGPNVMMGYALQREDLARGDELHGELRTGDLGYLDDDGYLFITGRIKRIAKVFGLRINLEELEAMVQPQGPAAVVSAGDQLAVFCEFGDDETFVQLRQELAERLGIHHSAFVFHRIDALPLNSNGKVDYKALDTLIPGVR